MPELTQITPHPHYTAMAQEVEKVRDCIAGSPFVKAKGIKYLEPFSQVDTTSTEAKELYEAFKRSAEFDEIPSQTEKTLIGKIKADSAEIELPDRIAYLESDIDRDGLSMYGFINSVAVEQLELKWCVAVADYNGLFDTDTGSLSKADIKAMQPRATINLYTRENVVDWHHSRANGVMQLDYIMLREITEEFDPMSLARDRVYTYIKLALDENGYYYQQKIICSDSGSASEIGEPDYPLVGGSPLKWLPVEVIADEEVTETTLPMRLGYLSTICDKALQRYEMSAYEKKSRKALTPTPFITGADDSFMEVFKAINGRDYIAIGQPNILPGESVQVTIVSADDHTKSFIEDKEQNEKEIRALGGVFPSDDLRQRTLGEAELENSNWMARLNPMIDSLERSMRSLCAYCAMFEGLVSPDDVSQYAEDEIIINLNREFAATRASKDDITTMLNARMMGEISRDEWLRFYTKSGWTDTDIEQLQMELETQAPSLTGMTSNNTIDNGEPGQ